MNLSIQELVIKGTAWCEQHAVAPANGQLATGTQPRTLRYYRALRPMAPPTSGGFSQRHDFDACLTLFHPHF